MKWGTSREVCFAPMTDSTDKDYFLVDDGAFNETIAGISRSVKLGDQVDMGPYSVWSMEDFTGGMMQAKYRDSQMFMWSSSADTEAAGVLMRPWPGWRSIYNQTNNPTGEYVTHMLAGNRKSAAAPNVESLWTFSNKGVVYRFDQFGTVVPTLVANHPGRFVTCVSELQEDDGAATPGWFLYALDDGSVYVHNTATATSTLDAARPALMSQVNGIVGYNKANYCITNVGAAPAVPQFYKRTKTGGVVTWTKVADCTQVDRLDALTVWNGKLWFAGSSDGWHTTVYSSDGATVTEAFKIPNFRAAKLVVHYGSLYFVGNSEETYDDAATTVQLYGKIYKYNGASLTKLWDGRNEMISITGGGNPIQSACSWGKNLVWTHDNLSMVSGGGVYVNPIHDDYGQGWGVTLYDAEADAIVAGPILPGLTKSSNVVGITTCVAGWCDSIVASFYDPSDYTTIDPAYPKSPFAVAVLRTAGYGINTGFTGYYDKAFGGGDASGADLITSQYVGGYPDEPKTWLSATVTYRNYDSDCYIRVTAYVDGVSVYQGYLDTASTSLDWTTERLQFLTTAGDYPRGAELRLHINIIDARSTDDKNHICEIKSVSVQFMPSPPARRKWNFAILASDDQKRLTATGDPDGESATANDLATEQAIYDKLFSYYSSGVPIFMWGPSAGGAASGSGIPVQVTSFNRASWRTESYDDQQSSRISLELVEIV